MKNALNLFLIVCFGLTVSVFSQKTFDTQKSLTEAAGYLQTGNFTEAEKVLTKAKTFAPNNSDVRNLLGIIYDQKGDFKQAEIEYQTAVRLNPKAVSPLANLGIFLPKPTVKKKQFKLLKRS